jgi:hypothetical protein
VRVELKYCVPEDVAARVLRTARLFLRPDNQAAGETQAITSLYLDTPSLTFLRWHLEGASERFKLRVRAYGAAPHAIVYAEVKRKCGVICRKRRVAVQSDAIRALLDGAGVPPSVASDRDLALHDFVWRKVTFGATPKVLTRSIRESWRDGGGGETAVTVDRSVTFRRAAEPATLCPDTLCPERGWQPMPLPQHAGRTAAVLELKHGVNLPAWMAIVIRELAPWRTSYSKYVVAMRHLQPWPTC